MRFAKINLTSNHSLGEVGANADKFEHNSGRRYLQQNEHPEFDLTTSQESILNLNSHVYEGNRRRSSVVNSTHGGASAWNQEQGPNDDTKLCSTSSICLTPLCRQFWKAGNYDDRLTSEPSCQNGTSYLRVHPKFLHSNATSHKWAFGAFAELLDNAVDEIKNGATFVIVDKTLNPRDKTPALLIQDNGGGMDPESMRRCLSFGFSDKNSKTAIGQYGNGFKTSSMRLGADVVVLSRHMKDRKLTQSVGLLSYTFLMQTRQDSIVVPVVDYQFNLYTGTWNILYDEDQFKNNLRILLQWSPFTTEAELLKHCDDICGNGTKIIIYNLWHNDEGKLELDFESDLEDIYVSGKGQSSAKVGSQTEVNEHHLANRLCYSLRAYLSILYLRVPNKFYILLRGRVVEYHNIASDLKFPEFILYRPHNLEDSVTTTIGFLKEAPQVNLHGFNVYHKNRLILPFWRVVSYRKNRGRGVVGVLEANFIQPIHSKQDFEKTPVFQKLEHRLKQMTQEYWDHHCGLTGYRNIRKRPEATVTPQTDSDFSPGCIYQPILFGTNPSVAVSPKLSAATGTVPHETNTSSDIGATKSGISAQSFHQNSPGVPLKRKELDHVVEPEGVKRTGVIGSPTIDTMLDGGGCTGVRLFGMVFQPFWTSQKTCYPFKIPCYVLLIELQFSFLQHVLTPTQLENQRATNLIFENRRLLMLCKEYEKMQEALNRKLTG
ncbi:protein MICRORCHIDIA 6-like isoform X2 [Primulina tabacum]|uniref:protein MICRORCHIDIA 6-like isoform X2 n=1 Tax=Primulina tabacum TaxID=48773 RepID=UPI003F5AA9C0